MTGGIASKNLAIEERECWEFRLAHYMSFFVNKGVVCSWSYMSWLLGTRPQDHFFAHSTQHTVWCSSVLRRVWLVLLLRLSDHYFSYLVLRYFVCVRPAIELGIHDQMKVCIQGAKTVIRGLIVIALDCLEHRGSPVYRLGEKATCNHKTMHKTHWHKRICFYEVWCKHPKEYGSIFTDEFACQCQNSSLITDCIHYIFRLSSSSWT